MTCIAGFVKPQWETHKHSPLSGYKQRSRKTRIYVNVDKSERQTGRGFTTLTSSGRGEKMKLQKKIIKTKAWVPGKLIRSTNNITYLSG